MCAQYVWRFHICLFSLRQGPHDLGTWKAIPVKSFIASQREVDSMIVFSHSGDFCEMQVMVTLSSSAAAGKRATTIGAAGAEAGVLFRFQKVNSGRSRLSRRISSVMTQQRSIQFSGISLLRARRSSSRLSGTGRFSKIIRPRSRKSIDDRLALIA